MIVFKLCLLIITKNKTMIIAYVSIFVLITVIMMGAIQESPSSFSNVETPVAWIDHDQTAVTEGMKEYLESYAVYKEIREERLDDAFFFRDVEVIIEIPEGFASSLTTAEPLKIAIRSVPDSKSSYMFTGAIDKYLNLVRVLLDNRLENNDVSQTVAGILSQEAIADLVAINREPASDYEFSKMFYNYQAYVQMGLIISIIGAIMMSFKSIDLRRRNSISRISNRKMNLILLAVNFLIGISMVLILDAASLIMFPKVMFTVKGFYFILSSLIFSLSVIALAYLITVIFDSKNIVAAMSTICSLGFAFITGVFIPQEFLDQNLLQFARILPSYWYVLGNNTIASTGITSPGFRSVYFSFLMQLLFAIGFIVIAIAVSKKRQHSEN